MKKVLIAIDYSPSSQKVAETGYELAKAMNASILLVHVIADAAFYAMPYSPIMGYEGFIASNTVMLGEELKNEAGNYLKASAKHLGDENIKTAVLEGNIADAILEYSKKEEVDLMVMGTHSHSGLYKLFIGDVAEKVLKHTSIPLLIIPNKEQQVSADKTEAPL